jgi:hypothetical protein
MKMALESGRNDDVVLMNDGEEEDEEEEGERTTTHVFPEARASEVGRRCAGYVHRSRLTLKHSRMVSICVTSRGSLMCVGSDGRGFDQRASGRATATTRRLCGLSCLVVVLWMVA